MNEVKSEMALLKLVEGNQRFISNLISTHSISHQLKRESLVNAQKPFAVILSCSDSRVPSEIIFDQGLGDLFVIRVAGNIVAPSLIGSVEFAVTTFGTELVVVMGHSNCGAVSAALDVQLQGKKMISDNVGDIVGRISSSIDSVIAEEKKSTKNIIDHSTLLDKCIRANVLSSIEQLTNGSKVLDGLEKSGKLKIVGAEYSLSSGKVEFISQLPNQQKSSDVKSNEFNKHHLQTQERTTIENQNRGENKNVFEGSV